MSKSKLGWKILLSGASLAAMGALNPAYAQDADQNSDEIIVTATGRSAALQDVPVAVTAIGAEQIESSGAHDLRDLTQLAPSFEMGTGQSNTSGTTARIRGIGTGSDNPGFEGAVGIFIDGVYRARAGAALTDLPELERVEVLRGPQGTLFGRNTSSGAISVVTAAPDFTSGVSADLLHGDLNESGVRAMVNMPVTDSLALRFDGSVRSRDGYITDLTSGHDINTKNRWSGRGQLLWDISPDATLRIIADAAATDEVCCGITPLVYGPAQGVISLLTGGAGTPAINTEARGMTVTPGRDYNEQSNEHGVSAQLDWDLGFGRLTSITSDRSWQSRRDQDIDFNRIDVAYRDGLRVSFHNFSEELRLQGESGPLNWLVGVYYGSENLRQTDTIRLGTQAVAYTNTAVFGGSGGTQELFNTHAGAVPSVFQRAAAVGGTLSNTLNFVTGSAVASNALRANINSAGSAGWLTPSSAGQGQQHDLWAVDTTNWSAFTHDEFNITDRFVLTVGARYNSETKDLSADLTGGTNTTCSSLRAIENATVGNLSALGFGGGIVSFIQANGGSTPMNLACNPAVNTVSNGLWNGSADENEVTYTASLAFHFSDSTMAYGGYSRGYKAGGYNVDRSGFSVLPSTLTSASLNTGQLHFDPEFTDSYEAGLRSSPFGAGSTLNLTAFYEQIHDYQLNAFNGFNFITRNIPDVISKGVELEASVRPMQGLSLTGGVTYNDAYYDSTVHFNPLTAATPGDPNAVFAGDPLSFAPKWVATAGVSYELPLGSNMHAMFYLDGRYNTEHRTETLGRDPLGRTDNGSFAIFNGRIGIGPRDDHWSVELWARNIADQFYFVGAFSPPLQDGTYVIHPNEPRTVGIELRGRW